MPDLMAWLAQYGVIAVALLIAVLIILIGALKGRRRFPYQAVTSLFSAAELKFLHALEQSLEKNIRVYAKVRIADVVKVRPGTSKSRFYQAFNAIACKHLDYVLCDAKTCAIVAVVELDDRSHQLPDRRERDEFVDAVLGAAGIPILHIPVQARYDVRELKKLFQNLF